MTNQQGQERTLSRIAELAETVTQPLGLAVLEVRFSQQGCLRSLEVCILRRHGEAIGLTDCEQVSRALDTLLAQEAQKSGPLIEGAYVLEVISPGIERQLTSVREFQMFAGAQIRVKTRENIGALGSDFACVLLAGDKACLKVKECRPLGLPPKVAKSKGVNNRDAGQTTSPEQKTENGQEAVLYLELSKVFKVNLYSEDLRKEGKPIVR